MKPDNLQNSWRWLAVVVLVALVAACAPDGAVIDVETRRDTSVPMTTIDTSVAEAGVNIDGTYHYRYGGPRANYIDVVAKDEGDTCALAEGGYVDCWAYQPTNDHDPHVYTAVQLLGLDTIEGDGLDYSHEEAWCGFQDGMTLVCGATKSHWAYSEMGDEGTSVYHEFDTRLSGVATDGINYCGLDGDGHVHCVNLCQKLVLDIWEESMGITECSPDELRPTSVALRQMSIFAGRACGITLARALHCWGDGALTVHVDSEIEDEWSPASQVDGGWIEDGWSPDGKSVLPAFMQQPWPEGEFLRVEVSSKLTCLLERSGKLQCYGRSGSPLLDIPDERFTFFDIGRWTACGVTVEGTIVCWGYNQPALSDAPEGKFVTVSVGDEHACAINEDDMLQCWGDIRDWRDGGYRDEFARP